MRRYSAAGSSDGEIQVAHGLRSEAAQDPTANAGPGRWHAQGRHHPLNLASSAATYLPSSASANSLLVLDSSSTGGTQSTDDTQSTGGGLGQVANWQ
jgi:hypothetical protein